MGNQHGKCPNGRKPNGFGKNLPFVRGTKSVSIKTHAEKVKDVDAKEIRHQKDIGKTCMKKYGTKSDDYRNEIKVFKWRVFKFSRVLINPIGSYQIEKTRPSIDWIMNPRCAAFSTVGKRCRKQIE